MVSFAIAAAKASLRFVHALFSLFPKHDRIVCISRQSDECPVDFRLIKDFVYQEHPDFEVVILAKAFRGKASYCLHAIKQLYFMATSKAIVLDSYCIAVSLLADNIKTPVIQMWHAMGNMKKFGYTAIGSLEGRSAQIAKLMNMHRGYDSILISSKNFLKDYAEGFGADPAIIYEAPLPRTDLLIDSEYTSARRKEILATFPCLKGKKNIVYCPTFRKEPAPNEADAMRALAEAIDFSRYNLIYKAHPVSTQQFEDEHILQEYGDYEMLYIADYVISDYSTVIYEAGLLDLPIYLYAYDWESYRRKRSLNIDIKADVPTLFTDNPVAIVEAIECDRFDHKAYAEFMRRNITLPNSGTCTQRVVDHIFKMVGNQVNSQA